MGSRTVYELKDNNGSIFLYSHWGGDKKEFDAFWALKAAEPRWSDKTYAMRIFISQIIGEQWHSETGFGISAKNVFEESFDPMVIDFDNQTVDYVGEVKSFRDFVH